MLKGKVFFIYSVISSMFFVFGLLVCVLKLLVLEGKRDSLLYMNVLCNIVEKKNVCLKIIFFNIGFKRKVGF